MRHLTLALALVLVLAAGPPARAQGCNGGQYLAPGGYYMPPAFGYAPPYGYPAYGGASTLPAYGGGYGNGGGFSLQGQRAPGGGFSIQGQRFPGYGYPALGEQAIQYPDFAPPGYWQCGPAGCWW